MRARSVDARGINILFICFEISFALIKQPVETLKWLF